MSSVVFVTSDQECDILVKNKNYGKTPKRVVVDPGFVLITLIHPTFGKVIKQVQIIDGDSQDLYHQWIK
jgi:hypothetical protein